MPGHGAAAVAAGAGRDRQRTSSSRRRCRRSCRRTRRRCSTASTAASLSLARFAGAARAEGSHRRPDRDHHRGRRPRRRRSTPVNDEATMKPLQDGLFAVRVLRRVSCARWRSTTPASTRSTSACARRKASSSRRSSLAHGIKIEALADDGIVVPGQPVKVNVIVANRGTGDVAIKNVKFDGFAGDARLHDDRVHRRRLRVPGWRPRRPRRQRAGGGADVERAEGSGRALRADADDSGRPRASASRTGIARAKRAATPSTPTRRSACRCGRRRSTSRSR